MVPSPWATVMNAFMLDPWRFLPWASSQTTPRATSHEPASQPAARISGLLCILQAISKYVLLHNGCGWGKTQGVVPFSSLARHTLNTGTGRTGSISDRIRLDSGMQHLF